MLWLLIRGGCMMQKGEPFCVSLCCFARSLLVWVYVSNLQRWCSPLSLSGGSLSVLGAAEASWKSHDPHQTVGLPLRVCWSLYKCARCSLNGQIALFQISLLCTSGKALKLAGSVTHVKNPQIGGYTVVFHRMTWLACGKFITKKIC